MNVRSLAGPTQGSMAPSRSRRLPWESYVEIDPPYHRPMWSTCWAIPSRAGLLGRSPKVDLDERMRHMVEHGPEVAHRERTLCDAE